MSSEIMVGGCLPSVHVVDAPRVVVNPLHGYFRPSHLAHVIEQMRRLGPPVLRACWDGEAGIWHAREGTHRLRAAKVLGLIPILVPVPWRRSQAGRVRARYAAAVHAHSFERVILALGAP